MERRNFNIDNNEEMVQSIPGSRQGFSLRNVSSLRNLKTFSSFKNPVYRLFFGGLLGQMVGMNMQIVARSYLIYQLTGSAAILGGLSLANAIPMISLSLFGGVIADKVQKKYVMLVGQAASAVISAGIGFALITGYLSSSHPGSWWVLAVSSVFQGVVMALMMPSRQAILPEIVSGEQLMNAISLTSMGMNTLRLFGPAIAGFLIEHVGYQAVYFTTASTYLVSVIFISFLPHTSTIKKTTKSALTSMKEGFRYLRGEPNIMFILLFTLVVSILGMPFMQLLPVFTDNILKVGAGGLGVLMSVSGAGSILSSLVLASLPNKRRGIMMLSGSLILGIALVGFSFSSSYQLSLVIIAFVGLGQMVQMALSNTLIQYYINPEYLGRVMSINMMQFGLTSLSTFVAGLLTQITGSVQWSVGSMAMVLICISTLSIIFLRRIRRLQ